MQLLGLNRKSKYLFWIYFNGNNHVFLKEDENIFVPIFLLIIIYCTNVFCFYHFMKNYFLNEVKIRLTQLHKYSEIV